MADAWEKPAQSVPDDLHVRVGERLAEQLRSAREWRDQVCTYFFRKPGVPDGKLAGSTEKARHAPARSPVQASAAATAPARGPPSCTTHGRY